MNISERFVLNLKAFLRFIIIFMLGEALGYPFRKYGDWAWAAGGVVGLFLFVQFGRWVRSGNNL